MLTEQNSVFTYYLIKGMYGKPAPADKNLNKKVTAEELFKYAKKRTTNYVTSNFYPYQQHPQKFDGRPGQLTLLAKKDIFPPEVYYFLIHGDTYSLTKSRWVTLELYAWDYTSWYNLKMRFKNEGKTWSAWEPYSDSKSWKLTKTAGTKTVYMQVNAEKGNKTTLYDTISYEP